MARTEAATDIYARVGDVASGSQVAIGHHIVQIGDVKGGIVYIQENDPKPPRARTQPVLLLPRKFSGLLDRATETSESIQALGSKESVECVGEAGSGKTTLLRHLAHQPGLTNFSAGLIYSQVNQQSNADLLKSLFDAFYEYDSPIKPTDNEIRHYLETFNALILLDDVEITPQQMQQLMTIVPNCTFIAATSQRSLFGEAREVTLKGLPIGDAISLFERELGRTLSAEERNAAEHLCELLGCNPQRILRAAHQAREENRSLVDIIPPDPSAPVDQVLATAEIESRSEDEKRVLSALAVFYGAPVAAQHVAAVAKVSGTEQILVELERGGLVQSHDKRYTLSSDLKNALPRDLASLRRGALSHFVNWVKEQRGNPNAIADSAEPILLILKWAVSAGFFDEARALGHGTEEALALSGKWDMWATALQTVLEAARAEPNPADESWALHQLGTRALCLGDGAEAERSLTSALAMREAMHDERGAAATRHNLNILFGPSPPTERDQSDQPDGDPGSNSISPVLKFGVPTLAGAALIAALVIGWPWLSARLHHPSVNTVTIPAPPAPPAPVVNSISLVALPKVLSFSASPPDIVAAESSQLCFELQDASSVTIDGIPKLDAGTGRQCVTVAPITTTTYTLTAANSEGKTNIRRATITVRKAAPQIMSFSADPNSITDEGRVRLCYNVVNGERLEIDNGIGEVRSQNEGCVNATVKETTTFTLKASGSNGRAVTRQTTVDVVHPSIALEFTANPPEITAPNGTSLCYQASPASSLSIDHGVGDVPVPPEGEIVCVKVQPRETTTYTLSAIGSFNRTADRRVTVSVTVPPVVVPEPSRIPPVRITGFEIKTDHGRSQLCYSVENAVDASIDHGVGAVKLPTGCRAIRATKPTTFMLSARDASGGSDQKSVSYTPPEPTVIPITILSFLPDTQTVRPGRAARICYRTFGVGTAQISPEPGDVTPGIIGETHCVKVSPTESTVYTLTVTRPQGGQDSRRVSVKVQNQDDVIR